MCQINFTITYEDANNLSLKAGELRYKLSSSNEWNYTSIQDIDNPKTPDITIDGNYDMDIRVQNSNNAWSDWFSIPNGFQIGNCNVSENPLIVNVGEDQSISSDNTSVTAIVENSNGNNITYLWEVVNSFVENSSTSTSTSTSSSTSVGSIIITNPNSATTTITGFLEGTYEIRCTVTNDNGQSVSDDLVIEYTEQIDNNTLFSVSKNGDFFKIESSRYINDAKFTLVFEYAEYESGGGSADFIDIDFRILGPYDLASLAHQDIIINTIQNNTNVLDTSVDWSESGGVYSVTFKALRNRQGSPPESGSNEYYLDSIKNVTAS